MEYREILEIYSGFIMFAFAIATVAIGVNIQIKKRPIVISGSLIKSLFVIHLLPALIFLIYEIVRLKSIALLIITLILFSVVYLLISLVGDFLVYNASEDDIKGSIECVLQAENVDYSEGVTAGLLAHNKNLKGRSIVTYYMFDGAATVRYAFNKSVAIGSVCFSKNASEINSDSIVNKIKLDLTTKGKGVERAPWFYFVIGVLIALFGVVRIL